VRGFLEGSANVAIADSIINIAVQYAASGGHLDMCRVLLDRGAKVDPVNRWKYTPLHLAAENGYLSLVKMVAERGADVRLKNEDGLTERHVAWRKGNKNVAGWLHLVKCG
jgi:ankyrin repeat protein